MPKKETLEKILQAKKLLEEASKETNCAACKNFLENLEQAIDEFVDIVNLAEEYYKVIQAKKTLTEIPKVIEDFEQTKQKLLQKLQEDIQEIEASKKAVSGTKGTGLLDSLIYDLKDSFTELVETINEIIPLPPPPPLFFLGGKNAEKQNRESKSK